MSAARTFSEAECRVLRIMQDTLPDSPAPFAAVAAEAGVKEEEVLALLRSLRDEGVIRRFGAVLRHRQAGYGVNAMVAWKAERAGIDAAGARMARHPLISHCYCRPSPVPDWPYELYTMVHGRDAGELERAIAEIARDAGLTDYVVLESIEELKKSSLRFF
ncbi:MAG: Lrp/AsnC family transcriptional regulator [Desulfovibrio sp.]|jgi:DNA-binding Lrp family transcriptional regulator|nr:Lrp/AsnC family transcriptional regulator [Desulfovibrio sp.]